MDERAAPKVIFLNGPPRCGKDTAGTALCRLYRDSPVKVRMAKFAAALKRGTHALFWALNGKLNETNANMLMDSDLYEPSKETEMPVLCGLTPRNAYIAVSELLCKARFGVSFFGDQLVRQMADHKYRDVDLWVITDSGFRPEALPVLKHFGRENCLLIRLRREGTDFSGDSRSYIELNMPTIDLDNSGTVEELEEKLRTRLPEGFLPEA